MYLSLIDDAATLVTLEGILVFATGADSVPPMGFFPKPRLEFWKDVRPRSNTCANVLYLPLHPECNSDVEFEAFKSYMDDAILNTPSFGVA